MFKVHLAIYAALLIASLWNYGQWQKTEALLAGERNRADALEDANREQRVTIEKVNQISLAAQEAMNTLMTNNNEIDARYQEARAELMQLRNIANVEAYEKPFEWGTTTTDRRKRLLLPDASTAD